MALVGLKANLTDQGAVIQLHTSESASFTVDRFAVDNSVTVWSTSLLPDIDSSKPELDLAHFRLGTLVSGAEMVQGSARCGLRFHVSAEADRSRAAVTQREGYLELIIPYREGAARPLGLQSDSDLVLRPVQTAEASAVGELGIEPAPSSWDDAEVSPTANGGDNSETLSDSAAVNYQLLDTGAEPEEAQFSFGEHEDFYTPFGGAPQVNLPRGSEAAGGSAMNADLPEPGHKASRKGGRELGKRDKVPLMDTLPVVHSGKSVLSGMPLELFEIVDTPLDEAITLLVAPSEMNIIVDSSVGDNAVSLSFKQGQTDLKGAMDLLTKAYGLDYVVEAGTIVVAAKDKINGSFVTLESRVFELSYADPLRVKTIIENSLFKTDPSVVNAGPEKIFVYGGENFTDNNEGSKAGAGGAGAAGDEAGAAGAGGGGGDGPASRLNNILPIETNMSSAPPNAIVAYCSPDKMQLVEEMVRKLDRKPTIVELEVRVCEISDTALKDLGLTVQDFDGNGRSEGVIESWNEAPAGRGGDVFESFSIGSFLRSGINFTAKLNTLIENGKVETLAQPVLSTVIDKQAKYFAGERIPYVARVSITNNTIQQEVEFIDVGVTLSFKPRLDEDGNLTIQVDPAVSSLVEFVPIGGGAVAPRTLDRQMSATVRVVDCEPFVMAGLINKREKETIQKIPGLGDLPWIGKWFRNKSVDNQRTEVVVIVTPKLQH